MTSGEWVVAQPIWHRCAAVRGYRQPVV